MPSSKYEEKSNQLFRLVLAGSLTLVSVVSVVCLSVVTIKNGKTGNEAQWVLNAVLPLFGSWVGTVLAFFFSRENFDAATKSVNEIAKQITGQDKLRAAKVKDEMIRRSDIYGEIVKKTLNGIELNFASDELKLSLILDRLEKANKGSRIPILDENDFPIYLIHRSNLDRFLAKNALEKVGQNIAELKLKDFLDNSEVKKNFNNGFAVVRLDADLGEAKEKMDKTPDCLDVLVTQSGTEHEPVLGWITNAKIEEVSKV